MTPDTLLYWAQTVAAGLSDPWGGRIVKAAGRLRAGDTLQRIEKDWAAIQPFIDEVMPIVIKHWPKVGPAINDLLPVIKALNEDLK